MGVLLLETKSDKDKRRMVSFVSNENKVIGSFMECRLAPRGVGNEWSKYLAARVRRFEPQLRNCSMKIDQNL